jgi:hypothetical protein
VNRLAREAPDGVAALIAAGEALRHAQLGGGDRDAIRSAARDEREAVEALVGQAGKLSPSVLEEVRGTLHAAASDDEVRELVRRGVLTEARQAMGLGGFGAGAAPAPARAAPARAKAPAPPQTKTKKKPDGGAAERRRAEAERKKAAKERVKAARAALRDAEKAATAAERERDAEGAQAEVERRRKELDRVKDG